MPPDKHAYDRNPAMIIKFQSKADVDEFQAELRALKMETWWPAIVQAREDFLKKKKMYLMMVELLLLASNTTRS